MPQTNEVVKVEATATELDDRIAQVIANGNMQGWLVVSVVVTCPSEALVVFVRDVPEQASEVEQQREGKGRGRKA